jgi:hypothetical protein
MPHPSVGSKNKPSKVCLSPAFTQVSCLACTSTLKVEAICSSEVLVDFQWITWHFIPEDSTLHNHRCEHLKKFTSVPNEVWGPFSIQHTLHLLYSDAPKWENMELQTQGWLLRHTVLLVLMLSTVSFRLCEAHIEGGSTWPICPGPWPKGGPKYTVT